MRLTLRVLSALLRYPDEAVHGGIAELAGALAADGALTPAQRRSLDPLLARLADDDLLDSQERYVGLFDRGRAVSLHLFEHVHGESRDRGQAMVDLRDRYEAAGLEITASELPDYLPLFLEYLSCLPRERMLEELAQPGVILSALAERLAERDPAYAAPLRILSDLAGAGGEAFAIAPADDPDDLAALDAAWEEEQVRFDAPAAPGAASCPHAAAVVARMQSPDPARSQAHG
ncbi:MAG: nitrate reductase molybdenum cofactor assembly chaperone [Sphingomonadales bacterium]|nr:nitrate reductase molybdenum cofactor assembly chaperone [Sphingomonadales bacterium]